MVVGFLKSGYRMTVNLSFIDSKDVMLYMNIEIAKIKNNALPHTINVKQIFS